MTVRRLKTYTAQTGYVYQYYFVGSRPALPEAIEAPATEYVFDVSQDRQSYFAVSIFLQQRAIEGWASSHGRELTEAEQYAISKLALFSSFDEISQLASSTRQFAVTEQNIDDLIDNNGLEL